MGFYYVMFFYMFYINCFCDFWYLINIFYIWLYVRIVKYFFFVILVSEKNYLLINKLIIFFVKISIILIYNVRLCI